MHVSAPSEGKRISATCRDVDQSFHYLNPVRRRGITIVLLYHGYRCKVDEATAVVEYLRNELGTLNDALVEVLPAMATPDHARVLSKNRPIVTPKTNLTKDDGKCLLGSTWNFKLPI